MLAMYRRLKKAKTRHNSSELKKENCSAQPDDPIKTKKFVIPAVGFHLHKPSETSYFWGFLADRKKRNQTADLLNAMRKTPESNVSNVYF